MSTRRLLHALAHELHYRPLPQLVGRQVVIEEFAGLTALARELLEEPGAALTRPDDAAHFTAVLGKYGLIDLAATLPREGPPAPTPPRENLRVWSEAGWLERAEDDELELALAVGQGLEEALAELRSGVTYGRLFLHTERLFEGLREWRAWTRSGATLPAGYLPRAFTIADACVTNYAGIWQWKHFYW